MMAFDSGRTIFSRVLISPAPSSRAALVQLVGDALEEAAHDDQVEDVDHHRDEQRGQVVGQLQVGDDQEAGDHAGREQEREQDGQQDRLAAHDVRAG